jgi:nicotinate dehydrogenase subunit A
VIVDNVAVRSCQLPVSSAVGKTIVTLEGLGTPEKPHPVQKAFIEEQASQCGYCLNGWILTAKTLLDKHPNPTTADIAAAFDPLICRCGGNMRFAAAVQRAAVEMRRKA